MTASSVLGTRRDGPVSVLELRRPERRNALDLELCRAITGRPYVLVFSHCYHSSVDESFVTLDSGGRPRSRPGNVGPAVDPTTTTRVAEQVTRFHGTEVLWTSTSPDDLTRACAGHGVVFGGDGRGGFVLPEFSAALDGIAAFVRLLGLVARTRLTLSQIDARIPRAHVVRRSVPTPWAVKGAVMRLVMEAAGERTIDTTDGVRVVEADGRWALVLPDPAEAVTHIWAEGPDAAAASGLLGVWSDVVESAGT